MIHLMTKQSILLITAIVSSQLTHLSFIILMHSYTMDDANYQILVSIDATMIVLDCVINCLCILMSFGFQDTLYITLCGKCDKCCKDRYSEYVKRKVIKKYAKSNDRESIIEYELC